MGYHILLHCRARLRPEFRAWITEAFFTEAVPAVDAAGNEYPALIAELHRQWHLLQVCDGGFQLFEQQNGRLAFRLSKKVNRHHGNLQWDYLQAMKTVIAPMSHIIEYCEIEHDDYGDDRYVYTDEEIREG